MILQGPAQHNSQRQNNASQYQNDAVHIVHICQQHESKCQQNATSIKQVLRQFKHVSIHAQITLVDFGTCLRNAHVTKNQWRGAVFG